MLLTLSSTGLLYAACVALYHADPKRSQFERLRSATRGSAVLRSAAAAMVVAALLLLASRIGWERAIPVALGVMAGGGIVCVLAAVFTPRAHVMGGTILLVVGAVAGIGVLVTQ